MPIIEYAFFDLDGCLSAGQIFSKEIPPQLRQEFPTMGEFLEFMVPFPTRRAVATGRSLTISRVLIDLLMNDLSVVEHGTVLYDPKNPNQQRFLIAEVDKFYQLREAKEELERFIEGAGRFDEQITEHCQNNGVTVKRMRDNLHILTYEFEPQEMGNAKVIADFLETQAMPQQLLGYLDGGKLVRLTSRVAVDYMPAVSKRAGVEAVIKLKCLNPSSVMIVGDSYHSDGPMMEAVAEGRGYLVCPANSDDRLKDLVTAQGQKGYIAKEPYFKGTMEGLRHFLLR